MTSAGTSRIGRVGLRCVTAVSVALSLALAAAPAQAAAPVTSHLRAAAAPATVLLNTPLVISGAISPGVTGKPVYLQRLSAGKWTTIGHVASGKLGAYSFTIKAKGKAGVLALRVMRPANSVAKAVVGKTLKVRLTKTAYKVTLAAVSKVNAGSPLVITGVVTPKTTGQVVLQYVKAGKWATLATGRLNASAYTFTKVVPADGYKLRVMKAFNATIAGGVSRSVTVTVFAKPTVAPKLALTSPDDALLSLPGHRLVFSTVKQAPVPTKSLTFSNTGSGPVTVSGLAVEGADASSFSLAPGQATSLTIPAGGTATVAVAFNPTVTTNCPVGTTGAAAYNIGNSVRLAGLVFSSTDPGLPGGATDLGGINSCNDSGVNEPVLDQVLTALGYTDVVATAKSDRRFIGQSAHIAGTDEITAPYFKVANPALPVSLTPLTHYSTSDAVPYHSAGWYLQGAALPTPDTFCNTACNKLWDFPADPTPTTFNQNQKLLPVPEGTETFTPTGNFGLYLGEFTDVNFTDDSLNLAHDAHNMPLTPPTYLHDIRVYPAYGVNHVAIPNTYLLAVDVTRVPDFKNNDFQDVVMVLHNAVPAS